MKNTLLLAALFAAFTLAPNLQAQPLVNIETVTVGDAGNAADTTGYGRATNVFRIGKYEVTISQYTTFLNSVARTNTSSYIVNLWTVFMTNTPASDGIRRSGSGTTSSPYSYSVIGSGNRPVTMVSWFDAARFANWLHNGATNGADTETGAYTLNGATNGGGFSRNAGASWWIPRDDEWYKAAYYKGGGANAGYWLYPTRSDSVVGNTIGGATNQANYYRSDYTLPGGGTKLTDVGAFSNSASAYGTFDQGGNVWEWTEELFGSFGLRGGSWNYDLSVMRSSAARVSEFPMAESSSIGFRVAAAGPTPITNVILAVEKTTNLAGNWQLAPIASNMVTPAGELNMGVMTNTNEFYRLKIRAVIQ